jgi:hypothetical protein
MDPEANLYEMRELVDSGMENPISADQAQRALELFAALDHWLMKGGYFPADWEAGR